MRRIARASTDGAPSNLERPILFAGLSLQDLQRACPSALIVKNSKIKVVNYEKTKEGNFDYGRDPAVGPGFGSIRL